MYFNRVNLIILPFLKLFYINFGKLTILLEGKLTRISHTFSNSVCRITEAVYRLIRKGLEVFLGISEVQQRVPAAQFVRVRQTNGSREEL